MKYDADNDMLYFVDSNGFLTQYGDSQKGKTQTTQGLCLSLSIRDAEIAVSSSVGSVSIVDKGTLKETAWLPCHDDAEAWIVTLGPNETMYTGGDDSTFCIWDLKSHEPIVRKRFMCGQTSGEFCPADENYLVQGGYDDLIRCWDARNWKRPVSELGVGGGVWRTRFTADGKMLAVPCMYNNAKLIANESGVLREVFASDVHSSIAYGACWIEEREMFATCSFYDKKVALWKF